MKPDSWQSGFANLTVKRENWRLKGWVDLGLPLLWRLGEGEYARGQKCISQVFIGVLRGGGA